MSIGRRIEITQYIGIPSIIIICYLLGEIFKLLILKKKKNYKYVPIIVGKFGGLIGLISYYISPEIILNVDNPITALSIGIISGLASTGSYELINKILKMEDKNGK